MATRGGARPGAGRKPGKVGRAKRELAEVAKGHAEAALRVLVSIAENGEAPAAARVTAATAILDRGYGRPRQSVEVEADVTMTSMPKVIEFVTPDVPDDESED